MLNIQFPFDLVSDDMKEGFAMGREYRFQDTKPTTDRELVELIQDFINDDNNRLAYNIGFLLGLYAQA
jgi:hypothetical protein